MALQTSSDTTYWSRARIAGAQTVMGWFRITNDRNAYSNFIEISTNAMLQTDSDGVTNSIWNGASQPTGSVLSVDVWYHLCLVVDGDASGDAIRAYVNGVLDITTTRSAASTGTSLYIGSNEFGEWFQGRFAYPKAWSVALSAGEIANEMFSIKPQRVANLAGWWPAMLGESTANRVKDFSGNGLDFTEAAGSLTEADGPPVVWGGSPLFVPIVTAASAPAISKLALLGVG